jgi:3-phosphoshikimate 1-carboxyvinyltransferase
VNPTRAGFLDALAMFGAKLKLEFSGQPSAEPVGRLSVTAQRLRGAQLDADLVLRAIDEVPILAVLGAFAEGETVIRGAAELRVKESDRLAQMALGLRAMGARVEELPDGLRIWGAGGKLPGGAQIDSALDHRIALAFSVAALAAERPSSISGAEWADVSFPGFFRLLRRLGAEVEILP